MSVLYSAYHWLLSFTGSIYYNRPSRGIFVMGITGTKGKSTALELINAFLESAGKKTALISSTSKKIGEENEGSSLVNTMPGRWKIQNFLNRARKANCEYALLEVTSEGVRQHRHRFIDWDVAIFLNLHPEHIESHGSFKKYKEAKLKFFYCLKKSKKTKRYFFINKDDASAADFERAASKIKGNEIIFFSRDDVYKMVESIKKSGAPDWLRVDFNIENLAAAVAFAKTRGIEQKTIERVVAEFKGLRGRMDFVRKRPFSAVVDYAHTPDSLRLVYENLRKNFMSSKNARLICVLGSAGGGRDKWKRPELGHIAASYCDKIILTSEDPYDEDPQGIINEIKSGISSSDTRPDKVYEILDRKEAIKKAIALAKEGDVIITTGMGSQLWFYGPRGERVPWDERGLVEDILKGALR